MILGRGKKLKYIVKVDIGSKQKYIFSSNRLKEIIGASEIIRYVTENLGKEVLRNMGKNQKLYTGNNNGNILFEAGGNAMYIFDDEKEAINFNKIFSKFVIEYFDGLELLIIIKEFDMQNKNIVNLYEEMEEMLTKKKSRRKNQFRRIGYGLTKICANTRKPAGYVDNYSQDKDKYMSKESKDKLNFYEFIYEKSEYYDTENNIKYVIDKSEAGNQKIIDEIQSIEEKTKLKNDFQFTNEVDIIAGERNEGSYIGITCIDGNGMGKKFDSFNNKYKDVKAEEVFESNKKYIEEFKKITEEVDDAYKEVFNETVKELIDNYDNYYEKIGYKKGDKVVPVRPIIIAGDDITFISNGKIAIEATKIFTEKITEVKQKFGDDEYNLTTSAGIAIVKRSHPFSRAVKLAGALEKNSKKKLREMKLAFEKEKIEGEKDASFIDWEINRGDTLDDISTIRNKNVVARPYIIVPKEKEKPKNVFNINDISQCENLKKIIRFNFDNFYGALNSINKSEAKSNLKSFFRTMNSQEIDADLFYLKYNIKDKIEGDIDSNFLKEVIYDAIDIMDLYTYVKGEK